MTRAAAEMVEEIRSRDPVEQGTVPKIERVPVMPKIEPLVK